MAEPATLRAVEARDHGALATTLARSFYDDPVWSWFFPDDATRLRRASRVFRRLLGAYAAKGVVSATDDLSAGALWQPPRERAPNRWLELLSGLPVGIAFGSALPRAARLNDVLVAHRPKRPHRYLGILGTDPERQGEGLGSLLVRQGLESCRRQGVDAYLESSNPRNVPFYRRHGFELVEELRVADAPPLAAMLWQVDRSG